MDRLKIIFRQSVEYPLLYLTFSVVTFLEAVFIWLPCCLFKRVLITLLVKTSPGNWDLLDSCSALFADKGYGKNQLKSFGTNSVALVQLAGQISSDQLETLLWKNVTQKLQTFPVRWLGYWFWKRDVKFNVKNHVSELKYWGKIWDTRAVGRLHQKLVNGEFPENRSPWSVTLIQLNLHNEPISLLAVRVHHCLGDEVEIAKLILSGVAEITGENLQASNTRRKAGLWSMLKTNTNLLLYQQKTQMHPWKISRIPKRNTLNSTTVIRFSENLFLDYIKAIAHYHGDVGISSILISAIAGAITKFLPENVPESPVLVNLVRGSSTGFTKHTILDSVCSAEAAVMKLNDIISPLGSSLVPPFRQNLALLRAFVAEINVFNHDNTPLDWTSGNDLPHCVDFSLCAAQRVPCTSVGVSFNAVCFQGHVRFGVMAVSTVLNEDGCEKLMKLVETAIAEAYERTKH